MNRKIQVIRSGRKTMAMQIDKDMSLIVRAPDTMPEQEKISPEPLSDEELQELADQAVEYVPRKTAYYARKEKMAEDTWKCDHAWYDRLKMQQ